jgi:thiamine-monophosphate kinase
MVNGVERAKGERLGEFDIIARYFAPLATDPAALALHDDVAVLPVREGQELVITCDTIIEGVHFFSSDPPGSIGHKALAVNLSDLAAKGARPCAYLLSLALPQPPSAAWLEGFASALHELQEQAGIVLVGGDTSATPGPLTITITALGHVPQGQAVLRSGAEPGDRLYVSGTIGDAYLGLRLLEDPALVRSWGLTEDERAFVIERYRRPRPRSALALAVRNFAQAGIDISDGLVGDIEKLCSVSHVGAQIKVNLVPLSSAAATAVAREQELLKKLITAGDDYEIVAALPKAKGEIFEAEAREVGESVTAIGEIVPGKGQVTVLDAEGREVKLDHKGFAHF